MATSPRCSTRKVTGAMSLWRDSLAVVIPGWCEGDKIEGDFAPSTRPGISRFRVRCQRRAHSRDPLASPRNDGGELLQAERHEAQFAFGVRNQKQHGFLAVFLQLLDALLDVGGVGDRLLRHLDNDVARG